MDTFSFYHQLMFFTENLQIVRLVHAQVAKKNISGLNHYQGICLS